MLEINMLQILGVVLGLFFIYKSYVLVKNKKENLLNFFLWIILGIALIVLSINLNTVNVLLEFFNMSSRVNMLFAVYVLLSLFLIFMLFKEVKNIQAKISKLNEEITIMKYKKERTKDQKSE